MEKLETFTWYGENGELLTFADLSESEQRVALIAAGALLRCGQDRKAQKSEPIEILPAAT
jgi:hypothetical protein